MQTQVGSFLHLGKMLLSAIYFYTMTGMQKRAETELNTAAHNPDRQQLSDNMCPYGTTIVKSYYWVSGKGMIQKLREPLNILNAASKK